VSKRRMTWIKRSSGLLILASFFFRSLTLPIWMSPSLFGPGRHLPDPDAMTIGCEEGTCCTSKCYLDENGVHHCVHRDGESCECGMSPAKKHDSPVQIPDVTSSPRQQEPLADKVVAEKILLTFSPCISWDPATPTPPPRDRSSES
jgi:hypothetical protein